MTQTRNYEGISRRFIYIFYYKILFYLIGLNFF